MLVQEFKPRQRLLSQCVKSHALLPGLRFTLPGLLLQLAGLRFELGSTWTLNLSAILHCPGDRDTFSKEWGSAAIAAAVMLKIDQRDDDK